MNRPRAVTLATIAGATAVFAALVWHHRWISDDGLIYIRTIRQIVAGNGPVFNAFERAEANTSAIWPWLVAGVAAVTGRDPARLAVVIGAVFSVAGLWLAMDGTRRLHRARGSLAPIVPGGALVVLGAFPFWDFATSGLETGLATLWLAAIWWCLVALGREATPRRQVATALLFGLGPLVRPDFAVPAAVFLIAGWWIVRPGRGRGIALAAAAAALPIGYEVFRAGYYGALVPLPALAKSASGSQWAQGLTYLVDFLTPCWLWVPIAVLGALGAVVLRRSPPAGRERIVVAAPVVSGALLALFVVKVGGDFMHARLLLVPAFLVLLPSLVLPWQRVTAAAVVTLAVWAAAIGVWRDDNRNHAKIGAQIGDERAGYLRFTQHVHPIDAAPFIAAEQGIADLVLAAVRTGRPEIVSEGGERAASDPALGVPVVFVAGRLGTGGAMTPVDGIVGDTLGLANPIGARITRTNPGAPGHEKQLSWPWLLADFGDPADRQIPASTPVAAVRAARHAMTCGRLAELRASVRAPMSASRWWDNLRGAIGRTTLVIPSDPFVAERTFCERPLDPDLALGATVTASSSYEDSGWSASRAVDGARTSTDDNAGFCSALRRMQPHEEWIELRLPRPETFAKVVLHPSKDIGFPIDFAIQHWKDGAWIDLVKRVDYALPPRLPQLFTLASPVTSDRVRLDATRLREHPGLGYLLQVAEIELLP